MNYVAGQDCLCTVYHKKWCESGSAIRRGLQPPEYGVKLLYQCMLDSVRDRTNLGLMPLMIRPFARST